jgi:hypothetical protein
MTVAPYPRVQERGSGIEVAAPEPKAGWKSEPESKNASSTFEGVGGVFIPGCLWNCLGQRNNQPAGERFRRILEIQAVLSRGRFCPSMKSPTATA